MSAINVGNADLHGRTQAGNSQGYGDRITQPVDVSPLGLGIGFTGDIPIIRILTAMGVADRLVNDGAGFVQQGSRLDELVDEHELRPAGVSGTGRPLQGREKARRSHPDLATGHGG
jgi:hypothetical protein